MEEEISAVEENLAHRLHDLQHRRHDYSTPYNTTTAGASSSSSSVVTSNPTTPASSPLLNYHVVDNQQQSDSSYINSLRFAYSSPSSQQQQQSPVTQDSSNVYQFDVPSTSSNYHSTAQGLMQQQQTIGTFIGGNTTVNVFDHPGSSQPTNFQRQNSGGSDHGFVVPTAQFVSQMIIHV